MIFPFSHKKRASARVLPGFGLTLGYTLLYLGLVVLMPLGALLAYSLSMSWGDFWATVSAPRVLAAFRLTFGASLAAVLVNMAAGPAHSFSFSTK